MEDRMQIDNTTMNNTLSTIGGVVIAIAAAFGVGNLLLAIYQRYIGKKDKEGEIHETNRGKELDFSSSFQDRLLKRVDNLESELQEMRDDQLEQVRSNARLTVENENLQKENLRQAAEIQRLTETVQRLETEIEGLKGFKKAGN